MYECKYAVSNNKQFLGHFSLTFSKISDISRFSRQVVTLGIVLSTENGNWMSLSGDFKLWLQWR